MNLWKCQDNHCALQVAGLGEAVGLKAIGWYFRRGKNFQHPIIYCPVHHPDATKCSPEEPCDICVRVKKIQETLE